LATVDYDAPFDKRQMDVQSFGIASERSCQIGCGDARQKCLPSSYCSYVDVQRRPLISKHNVRLRRYGHYA
jgi:hypothetical protein